MLIFDFLCFVHWTDSCCFVFAAIDWYTPIIYFVNILRIAYLGNSETISQEQDDEKLFLIRQSRLFYPLYWIWEYVCLLFVVCLFHLCCLFVVFRLLSCNSLHKQCGRFWYGLNSSLLISFWKSFCRANTRFEVPLRWRLRLHANLNLPCQLLLKIVNTKLTNTDNMAANHAMVLYFYDKMTKAD